MRKKGGKGVTWKIIEWGLDGCAAKDFLHLAQVSDPEGYHDGSEHSTLLEEEKLMVIYEYDQYFWVGGIMISLVLFAFIHWSFLIFAIGRLKIYSEACLLVEAC